MLKFRNLTANEIECRVSTVNQNGCSLLLYKDARCDMRILDETVGAERWQRSHELINGNLFCNVSINIPDDSGNEHWICKQDVGTESYTEKEKGQASDAFKRACFNWGIGRELYTAPFIWIGSDKVEIKQNDKKWTTRDRFLVSKISIKDGEIISLQIKNAKSKKVVFEYDNGVSISDSRQEEIDINKVNTAHINTIRKEIERTGIPEIQICHQLGVNRLEDLTMDGFKLAMDNFIKTPNKKEVGS